MSNNSRLIIGLTKVFGTFLGATFGRLDRYTREHKSFLASGFVCEKCRERLLGKWGIADVKCYDSKGGIVPLMQARFKGKYFECPKCLFRWSFRENKPKKAEPSAAADREDAAAEL